MSWFLIYVAITVLGDAALLHLALIYPRPRRLAPWVRVALYAPAVVAIHLAAVTAIGSREALATAVGTVFLVAQLFAILAGILFLLGLLTSERSVRHAARLPLVATGLLAGSIAALPGAAGLVPGEPEAWSLALGVIPVTLAIALVSMVT